MRITNILSTLFKKSRKYKWVLCSFYLSKEFDCKDRLGPSNLFEIFKACAEAFKLTIALLLPCLEGFESLVVVDLLFWVDISSPLLSLVSSLSLA